METWVFVLTFIVAGILALLLVRSLKSGRKRDRGQSGVASNRRRGGAAARRQATSGSARSEHTENTGRHSVQTAGDNQPESSEGDGEGESIGKAEKTAKKKIGAKKALKLVEKEKRKEEREAEERYREQLRKAEDEEIRKRKKEEDAEAAAEAFKAAEIERLRLEDEARQQAEYELLKASFSVADEGLGVRQLDAEAEEKLNQEFIAAIHEAKIITLERLCIEFDMKTDACVEKIRSLINKKMLSGVLDDRGKFILIEDSEYEAIAKFIELRGRVSMSELVELGNSVLKARNSRN